MPGIEPNYQNRDEDGTSHGPLAGTHTDAHLCAALFSLSIRLSCHKSHFRKCPWLAEQGSGVPRVEKRFGLKQQRTGKAASTASSAGFPDEHAAAAGDAAAPSRGGEASPPPPPHTPAPSPCGVGAARGLGFTSPPLLEAPDNTRAEVSVGAVPGRFPGAGRGGGGVCVCANRRERRERAIPRKPPFFPRAARGGGGGDYKSRLPGEEPARGCRSPSLPVGAQRSPATARSPAGSARRGRPATFLASGAGQGSAPRAAEESRAAGGGGLEKGALPEGAREPGRGLRRGGGGGGSLAREPRTGLAVQPGERGCVCVLRGGAGRGERTVGSGRGAGEGSPARDRGCGAGRGAAGQGSPAGELLLRCRAAGQGGSPGAGAGQGRLAGGGGAGCRPGAGPLQAPRVRGGRAGGRAPRPPPPRFQPRGVGAAAAPMGGGGGGSARGPPAAADAAAGRPRGG